MDQDRKIGEIHFQFLLHSSSIRIEAGFDVFFKLHKITFKTSPKWVFNNFIGDDGPIELFDRV